MRFRATLFLIPCLLFVNIAAAQEPPPRDARAVAVLQQSLAAMGGAAPADSVAVGSMAPASGATNRTASVRILTRGIDETSEEIEADNKRKAIRFSRGHAARLEDATPQKLNLELAATSKTVKFPLIFLLGALADSKAAFEYVARETFEGRPVHHLKLWTTFPEPRLRHLSEFSAKHVWIDAASALPLRISFDRRSAAGSAPRIPVEVSFSDYRNVGGGVLYPFVIRESVNGTPYAVVTIDRVVLNSGQVKDADVSVR